MAGSLLGAEWGEIVPRVFQSLKLRWRTRRSTVEDRKSLYHLHKLSLKCGIIANFRPNRINCQLASQFAFAEMGGARGTRDKEQSFSLFNSVVNCGFRRLTVISLTCRLTVMQQVLVNRGMKPGMFFFRSC